MTRFWSLKWPFEELQLLASFFTKFEDTRFQVDSEDIEIYTTIISK